MRLLQFFFFSKASCNIVNVNPSAVPGGNTSTWACIHVDFQNAVSTLPPLGLRCGFPVEHLTLSCCLRLVRHYKETTAPHSSFSQVTIEMRVRNAQAVGLDLNSVAVETPRGPNIGRGGSATRRGVGFHCQIFEELPMGRGGDRFRFEKKQRRGRKEEQEK